MAWLLLERELQCRVSPLQETLALSSGTVARQACASAETPTSGGSAPSSGSTRDSTGVSEAFLRPLDTLLPEGFIESGLPRERSATQPLCSLWLLNLLMQSLCSDHFCLECLVS